MKRRTKSAEFLISYLRFNSIVCLSRDGRRMIFTPVKLTYKLYNDTLKLGSQASTRCVI
jgi:hypothetical protein